MGRGGRGRGPGGGETLDPVPGDRPAGPGEPRGTAEQVVRQRAVDARLDRRVEAQPRAAVGGGLRAEADAVCLLYTSPSPRDRTRSRMPSFA